MKRMFLVVTLIFFIMAVAYLKASQPMAAGLYLIIWLGIFIIYRREAEK